MASVQGTADDIRSQMASIRSRLHYQMKDVVTVATTATDWRSYVRSRPWLAVSLAVAAGYLAVPHRPRLVVPATLAHLTEAVPPEPRETRKVRGFSLLRTVGALTAPLAVRIAQNYALHYLNGLMSANPPGPQPRPAGEPGIERASPRTGQRDLPWADA